MKGAGANVDPRKGELSFTERLIVNHFLASPEVSYTAKEISAIHNLDIRKTSSILSNLVGMDLIKSSSYRMLMTDEEKKKWEPSQEPVYWIPDRGTPWYQRSNCVINECRGNLSELKQMQFGLNLWPARKSNKFEFENILVEFMTEALYSGGDEVTWRGLLEHKDKKCKVIVEVQES